MANKGIIKIEPSIILGFLQFPNGEILHAEIDEMGLLKLCISDSEMPKEDYPIPVVTPTYTRYQDVQGHWVAIRNPL